MVVSTLIENESDRVPLADIFLEAKKELESYDDKILFQLAKSNTLKGMRWGTYHSYLRPTFNRTNLKILYSTRVKKVGNNP